MHKPIIAAIVLCSAYAVANTLEPPNDPAQVVTPAPSVASPAGGVLEQPDDRLLPDIPLTEAEFAELQERLRKEIEARQVPAPAPQSAVANHMTSTPAAGGFCTTGNCGPAATRRVYQVQRPQRAGLFRGRIFGRR